MLHHHIKFGNFCSSEDIIPANIHWHFLTFAVTLTLNVVIQFFHRTLWLMMLYYQTKFGCKSTSSVEDTTEIVIFWLYKSSHNHTRFGILNFRCDLDIEHSNPIFPQDTPAYDAVIIYHVCWQTDQQFRTTPVASTQRSKWMDRSLRQPQASNTWAQL